MNLGQLVQSHALSFFHLSSPDLLLGMDADPKERNIFGLIKANPGFATDGVRLRKFGQEIIERLGGKRIHPAWCVPGGVNAPLTHEHRDAIREGLADAFERARRVLDWLASTVHRFEQEIESFANFPTLFMGLVGPDRQLEHYDGALRVCDARGAVVVDIHDPRRYGEYIGEHVEPWSYLKSPYFRPGGYPDGIYRVGPLARLICAERCGTPLADEALTVFRERWGRAPSSSFHYHWARLIEIVYGLERIARLLDDPAILDERVQSTAGVNRLEGVGISEAPRGTIIHHYKISPDGLMQWANLIIATGHNNLAMNRGVKQVAERFVDGHRLEEGMLNRVEAVVRAFDPCLSCSTHAWGQMPLEIQLRDAAGQIVDRLVRADNT
jgi:NAD-reducing hydrogenase large subunit